MSRRIGVRAVQYRSAVLETMGRLLQIEATDLKEVIDTHVHSTVFKPNNKDVCGISRASCQRLKQGV